MRPFACKSIKSHNHGVLECKASEQVTRAGLIDFIITLRYNNLDIFDEDH